MSLTQFLNQSLDLPRLHELLAYESYDQKTQLFFNEDTTGFVLLANPIVGAGLDDQQHMAQFFRQEQNLPEGAALQFLLMASPHIESALNLWQDSRVSDVFRKLAHRRAQFITAKAFQDSDNLLVRDFRLLISYTLPGHCLDVTSQQRILTIRKELLAVLETLGVYAKPCHATDLIREVGALMNWDTQTPSNFPELWDENVSLSKQLIPHEKNYHVIDNGLFLNDGQTLCRSYIPKTAPRYWSLGHMDHFLGNMLETRQKISCPFVIHYGLFVDSNQTRSKTKIMTKRESLESSLKGGLSKFMPTLKDQYDEVTELAEQLQLGERVVLSGINVTLWSTPDQVQEHEQQLRAIWQSCGWTFQPARYDHLPLFLSNLPMTWVLGQKRVGFKTQAYGMATYLEKANKAKKTITKEAQNMLPILGEWKGQRAPGMPLVGRRGQLFFWNPFGEALLPGATNAQTDHNYNVCIAGQSGSGKSVFMNELMATVMGVGGKVFVLDLGRSFKKTCQILQGQHVEFDIRLPISLNPFTHIPEGYDAESTVIREEMLAMVAPIFQVMAAPKQGTSDLENAYLEQAIRHAWERAGPQSCVDTVKEFLDQHADKVANNLGQTLYPFSSAGSYGHFFNQPANASFQERLVVIETDHLRNYPSLMAVVVQMLIIQINQEMSQGDRKTPFLIIIDEAWKLLSGKNTADFISEATRTARKYKGSIVLGTQHLTDYFKPESPAATEAFNCSAWKCILYQEPDVITSLKNHPQLQGFVESDYKESLLKSIHSKPPHYSEIAFFGPHLAGIVGRLRLDPFSRLLYSTNAEEYRLIEEFISKGASIEEAIELVMAAQESPNITPQEVA